MDRFVFKTMPRPLTLLPDGVGDHGQSIYEH